MSTLYTVRVKLNNSILAEYSLPNGEMQLMQHVKEISALHKDELIVADWDVEGNEPVRQVYYNGEKLDYVYSSEWKYTREGDAAYISKIPASDFDENNRIEQVGSKNGYGHDYYSSLEEAVRHSHLPSDKIQFVDVSQKELLALFTECENERD